MSQSDRGKPNHLMPDFIAMHRDDFLGAFNRGEVETDVIDARDSAGFDAATQPSPNAPYATAGVQIEAVTGSFNPGSGILSVFGDALDNTITFSRNAAGEILVNGGAVSIRGATPTVANTALIQAFGQAGNDAITVDEANGALPPVQFFGGSGNDTLTGGSGADMLFGQADNDTLLGKGGNDLLFGGSGNDVLVGGDGADQMFGEAGNDRMIWNPGDDSDLMEGGDGVDTAEVNGGNGAEVFTVAANGERVRFDRLTPAPFSLDIGTTENLVVNMNGGDDSFSATGNLASLINVTVDGGAGNDIILGGNGNDMLIGGDGNDFIDGNQGNDTAFLGIGDDAFQWDPGDGSDTVEGGDGTDRMLFNGANIAERFELSANGGRMRLTRDVGGIVMDTNDVEVVDMNARGGADTIVVNDLTGTDVAQVNVDLAAAPGSGVGDGAADTVDVRGSNGADAIQVVGAGTSVSIVGLSAQVNVTNFEAANDRLIVNGGGGNDVMTATTLPANVVSLTMDGGAGNDTLLGSQGADTLIGGDGNDFILGDNGNDVAQMGAGDDMFQWNPGDGNDTMEGGDGNDAMLFFGANIGENIDISANGGRTRFFRDIANVTMDLNDVENIEFRALGGADNVVVGDLTGTDVRRIDLDLRGPNGGGDSAADSITVNGTQAADVFGAAGDAGGVTVFGLQAAVNILSPEGANDRLTLNGQGGDDVIDATNLEAGAIQLTINGGIGADVMRGSQGDDLINGGDGDDTAFMGAGDDTFVWNPGDDNDTIDGQAGFDTMQFNGANIAENIDISANGSRVRFSRDIASVTMDLNDVERIDFTARGGADHVTVNDLSGTGVTEVNVDLAGTPGSGTGDNAADNITVRGTSGDDVALVVGDASGISVLGLAAQVNITGGEAGIDTLTITTGAGDDVIDASGLAVGTMRATLDGGDGDDILIASPNGSVLLGGAGDDVLIGGPGNDVLDGGTGNNIVIGGGGSDTFVNASQIHNFQASQDVLDLRSVSGLTFDWLMSHAHMVDGDAVLDVGNGSHITLVGVDTAQLHAGDFLLGA